MKSKVALLCLGLVSAGFCVDEYLPIAPKTLEVDVGVNPVFPEVGDMAFGIPLQVKYGMAPGLDLELATAYSVTGPATGLVQPDIAVKYALGMSGLAVYGDVILPFAVGEYADLYTGLGIAPGVVYNKISGQILAIAKASYQINFEQDGATPDNVLDIYLKPGYIVSEMLTGYVGLDYKNAGGNSQITLLPGVNYTLSKTTALEVNLPVVVSSDIGPTSWGIWASVYLTL